MVHSQHPPLSAILHKVSILGALLGLAPTLTAVETVLESRRLHLGKVGQWEWESFKDVPVHAEQLELRFSAKPDNKEHTLRLWQRDVKLNWTVFLNGQKVGTLVTAETAMETLLPIPTGVLKEGENVLLVKAPTALDDIEIGAVTLLDQSTNELFNVPPIEVTVTDAKAGAPMPCRLTVTKQDGTLQPLRATPENNVSVRTGVVYTRNGKASLSLPPGDYVIYAGRGFEWSVSKAEIKITANQPTAPVSLQLRREVPTEGWVAADSHIHTLTYSGHGDATIEERMLTIAGEGIELAVATDHNHHTDYAPVSASMGLQETFTPVRGNEITTKHGHFNAFPIDEGARVVDHTQDDWSVLIPAARATPGVKVITLNHPRDLHSGFIPFGGIQFNPVTGRHRQKDALEIDAVEVITSAAMQSDIHLLYRDWFALLNHGHRISAIASSDSHDVNRFILGQGRTYVAVPDGQPGNLDLDLVWRSYKEGRLLVSLGLLTQVKVNDRFIVGDLATGLSDTVKVEATVYGPSWTQADHIGLYANGFLIRRQTLTDPGIAGEKARIAWQIPRPKHDVHLVIIATGPGVTAPYWEIPRPYQPSSKTFTSRVLGSTNPVWLDADGDGHFSCASVYAQELVKKFDSEPGKLEQALREYDQAVADQVGTIEAN